MGVLRSRAMSNAMTAYQCATTHDWAMPDPVLSTDRCVLRPLTTHDRPLVAELYGNPQIVVGWNALPYTGAILDACYERLLGTWRTDGYCQFAIDAAALAVPEAEASIGIMGVRPTATERVGELGYLLAPAAWGHGIAVEAARAVLAWAFDDLHQQTIVADGVSNPASIRVLEKLGFACTKTAVTSDTCFYDFALHTPHGYE